MVACVVSSAQVFIINDNLTAGRLAEVEAAVIDSLTNDPVAFASVYVVPVKDTAILNACFVQKYVKVTKCLFEQ